MSKLPSKQPSNPITLRLSRSIYPVDSSVVGTVTINNTNSRQNYLSIKVYVAGRCRLDSRWHKNIQESVLKLYGRHPCHDGLPDFVEERAVDCYFKKGGSAGASASSAVGSLKGKSNNSNVNATNLKDDYHSTSGALSSPPNSDKRSLNGKSTNKKRKNNQTFCYWSTNVLTLWKDGNEINVPIYHDATEIAAMEQKGCPQTLILNNSEWYDFGTKVIGILEDGSVMDGDFHDLAYDEEDENVDDDDDDDEEEEEKDDGSRNESGDGTNYVQTDSDELFEDANEELKVEEENDDVETSSFPSNFTFKADLPKDLPPTVNATSARYFYSVVLAAETTDGTVHVYQAPFAVVTPKSMLLDGIATQKLDNNQSPPQQTKIRIGTIHAVAHSTLNPIALSSTYVAEPWRTSIQRVNGGWDPSNVRSIIMEESGYKCAALTIVGGVAMVPGEKVMLHFDFAQDDESVVSDDGSACMVKREILPCHMACACLQGEENVLGVNGSATRSRSYVFDTAYANVDPDCTKSVSLSLSLPLDCPITLNTDLLKIEVNCRVDLTVKMPNSNSFKFLTVQFPCQVVSDLADGGEVLQDDKTLSKEMIGKIMQHRRTSQEIENCNKVICPEVLDDLSMLSMHMLHKE